MDEGRILPDPFSTYGMRQGESYFSGLENKYLYNGKELQDDDLGGVKLDWYDYGARFYDASLGRWFVPDPLALNYVYLSPYNHALNNPLRYLDPDGDTPRDVINTAKLYINTWYEFGGKNPFYNYISTGSSRISRTHAYWTSAMSYSSWLKAHKKGYFWPKSEIYKFNMISLPRGYSMGIDCSGLSRLAFNSDPDKLMDDLPNGANNQMVEFKNAAKRGKGFLHKDFSILAEGDLIFRVNEKGVAEHVMIATGKIKKDAQGNIIEYEVIEAPGKGKKVKTSMLPVKDNLMIGHTLRKTDLFYVPENDKKTSWLDFWIWVQKNNLQNKLK